MPQQPSRRTVLKSTLAATAAAAMPIAAAKEVTVAELGKGLAKPLTPAIEKLAEAALKDVMKASADRLKHRLPENSEPSMIFQVRPGDTVRW